jgi:hypothetical protein
MNMKSFATTASAAALALTMWITPGIVQGQPLYDRIQVNLPYKITLGEKTLEPGDYTIQRLPDNGGGGRVLLFYTDNGMKFETSAMTIPALDPNTARDTKLILNRVGDDYYIEKIWVQGKDYGYELPMPKGLKARENEKMTRTTLPAQTQPTTETAQNTEAQPKQPAETTPPVTSQTEVKPTETTPQTPAAPPAETAPPAQPTTPQPDTNSADRAMTDKDTAPARMPDTAANWLLMLLSGGALSGAGMMLRRRIG